MGAGSHPEPILALLLTVRRGEVGPGHPLQAWLADVRRLPAFTQLSLGPLDLEETRRQVGALVGAVPHDSLVREVHQRTGGNAYLNRLLVAGISPHATSLGDHALPEDLTAAVLRGWHRLSPAARELTRVAAVGGRVVRGQTLRHALVLAGVDDGTSLLRECVEAEVLDPQPLDGYWFHHPLQAEALEASLPAAERRRLHAGFAAALERDLEGRPADLSTATLIADHHHGAGDAEAGFSWSLQAADAAEAGGADGEVVRHLQRALLVFDDLDDHAAPATRLLQRLREAAARAGQLEQELDAVEALLGELGDAEPVTTSELIVRRQHLRFSTGAGFLDLAPLRTAVDLAASDAGSWQHALAVAEAAHASLWADSADAQRLAARALDLARAAGHPRALAHACAANAMAAVFEDRLSDGLALAREGVAAGAQARDGWAFVHAALWEANAVDAPLAERYSGTLAGRRQELRRLGLPHPYVAWLAAVEGQNRLFRGEWEGCLELLREALGSSPGALVDVLSRLAAAQLAARQGRPDEAQGHLARADELFTETSTFLAFPFDASRAIVRLAAGDLRGCVDAALAGTTNPGVPVTMCEWLMPLAARALADLAQRARDDGGDVAPVAEELDALADRFPHIVADLAGNHAAYARQVAALDALYQAELARGRQSNGVTDRWATAAELLSRIDLQWEACYAFWRLAEALFRSGPARRSQATEALRTSHRLCVRLGASPDLDRVLSTARSARVPLGEPLVPGVADEGTTASRRLTAREEEVLAHIVAGRTYGEIARALVLSEKTVSSHVSHLLAKTGTANRVDLAGWATRRHGS